MEMTKKHWKRILSLALALVLTAGLLPALPAEAAEETPEFKVAGVTYTDLGEAIKDCRANGTILVTKGGVISGGEYTLENNKTLLLPYAASETDISDADAEHPYANSAAYSESSATKASLPGDSNTYLKLTFENVQLTVESGSSLVLGGQYTSGSGGLSGQTYGSHSDIFMDDTSLITVNGGILSCVGFIQGGTVTVQNGGTVYEPFVIADYNGGTYTVAAYHGGLYKGSGTVGTANSVLPFSIYSMYNIQSPMTFKSGCELYGYCDLYTGALASGLIKEKHNITTVKVISTKDALMNLISGELQMSFDSSKTVSSKTNIGKTTIVCDGDLKIGYLTLALTVAFYDITVQSNILDFPIPYNIGYVQNSGTLTIPSGVRLKMLPGSEVAIEDNANMVIEKSGKLLVYEGLVDPRSNKRVAYPTGAELKTSYSQTARLIVDGELSVNGTLAGKVETSGKTGKIVVGSAADLSENGYEGVEAGWGLSVYGVEKTESITTRTAYPLTAQIVSHNQKYSGNSMLVSMEKGKTYYAVSSENLQTETGYSYIFNPSSSSTVTTGTYNPAVTLEGTWSTDMMLYDIETKKLVDTYYEVEDGYVSICYEDPECTVELETIPSDYQGVVYVKIKACSHPDAFPYDKGDAADHIMYCVDCNKEYQQAHQWTEYEPIDDNTHTKICFCGREETDVHEAGSQCSLCKWDTVKIDVENDQVIISGMASVATSEMVFVACYQIDTMQMVDCDMMQYTTGHLYFDLAGLETGMTVKIFITDSSYVPKADYEPEIYVA